VLLRLLRNSGDVGNYLQAPDDPPDVLDAEWADLWREASSAERELIVTLADQGVPVPELGVESNGGIPIPISWPGKLVATALGLDEDDVKDLVAEGWTVLPEGLELRGVL
jgi:hypothetical protein